MESRYSALSISAISICLMSMAPRPQMKPSSRSPENGPCTQFFSVPSTTGTTSWCAMNRAGKSVSSLPFRQISRL